MKKINQLKKTKRSIKSTLGVPMPPVFGFNVFHKLYVGMWKAIYYKSYLPRFGGINNYSYCKLGFHIKGYLFEIIWTR